jgi:polysaccharide deacetylase 2 family uncharacterized protein YibQ
LKKANLRAIALVRSVLFLPFLCLVSVANAEDQRPVLSLVIDDLGYSLQKGQAAIELEGDHTYAIIPNTTYGKKLANFANEMDKEVILHLPLQSSRVRVAREPNALNESMNEDQLEETLQAMLTAIPNIKGINNHMGSRLTEIDYFMRPIMDSIRSYNPELYFLDSLTTPNSVARLVAQNSGLNSISRDVFLDNDYNNVESIRLQFQIWLRRAESYGSAIAIGHPHQATVDFLNDNLPDASKKFNFMSVSRLIDLINHPEDRYSWWGDMTQLNKDRNTSRFPATASSDIVEITQP